MTWVYVTFISDIFLIYLTAKNLGVNMNNTNKISHYPFLIIYLLTNSFLILLSWLLWSHLMNKITDLVKFKSNIIIDISLKFEDDKWLCVKNLKGLISIK